MPLQSSIKFVLFLTALQLCVPAMGMHTPTLLLLLEVYLSSQAHSCVCC